MLAICAVGSRLTLWQLRLSRVGEKSERELDDEKDNSVETESEQGCDQEVLDVLEHSPLHFTAAAWHKRNREVNSMTIR